MWNNFLRLVSFDRMVIRWALGALVAIVFSSLVAGLLSVFFHTSFMGGWAMMGIVAVCGGSLAIGLTVETMYKSDGREPPSFLWKSNRILIGCALGMAVAFVAFQLWMIWGASIHFFSPTIWVMVGDLLIPLLLVGCGFAAMSLGQQMGKEFLPAVWIFLAIGTVAMGLANTGESLVDPAIDGDLYYAWDTASCGPEAGHETPELTTAWFLKLQKRHFLVPNELKTLHGCPAKLVDFDDPTHVTWVRAAELKKEADRGATVWQVVKWVVMGLVGLGLSAMAGGLGFRAIKSVWSGQITASVVLWRAFACVVIFAIFMCTGLTGMRLFGLTPEVEGRQLRHEWVGGPNPFYRTITVGPQAKQELGVPDQTEIGYLCQCGAHNTDVAVYGQWTAWAKYHAEIYPMWPKGCGRQVTFEGDQLYFVWNRARGATTPPMKFLRMGESFTCPDMTVVNAPPLPLISAAEAEPPPG